MAAGYRSQEEFSALLPLHRTTVTKIENGTRHVTQEVLAHGELLESHRAAHRTDDH